MQRIAEETEEDYQKLISLLKSFNVDVLRPDEDACEELAMSAIRESKKIPKPAFMQPRDHTIMLGEEFYVSTNPVWSTIRKQITNAGNVIKQKEELHLGTVVKNNKNNKERKYIIVLEKMLLATVSTQ